MPDDDAYPFVQALGSNNVVEVERLLRAGRSISERFAFGLTPLHVAAQHGAADCVSLLLECGAEREAHDQMGLTPLLYALSAGSRETAARLIRSGALIVYRYVPKDTPGIRAQTRRQHEELLSKCRQAHPLLHGFVDLTGGGSFQQQMTDGYIETVISPTDVHAVHHCGNMETLELIAQQPGVSFNIADAAGYWPLKSFAEQGDAKVVAWLLQHGTDPNFTSTGDTALHMAVMRDHIGCARLLLDAGANPNQQDVDGCVPLWAVQSEPMLDLLLAHGADPTIGDQCGLKPSHWVKSSKLKKRLRAAEKQRN
jgi:hypothetical protein